MDYEEMNEGVLILARMMYGTNLIRYYYYYYYYMMGNKFNI